MALAGFGAPVDLTFGAGAALPRAGAADAGGYAITEISAGSRVKSRNSFPGGQAWSW